VQHEVTYGCGEESLYEKELIIFQHLQVPLIEGKWLTVA
jgi:hypothetical protein